MTLILLITRVCERWCIEAFTPSLIGQMRDRIQTLADELLEGVARKGEMDLIKDYALPLPMTIITEILGVPTSDHNKFHKWSQAVVSLSSPKATLRVIPSVWMFIRYLRRFFRERRRDPRDDLASALIQAEEAGDKLSEDELLAMVFLLLIAGHETTVNLIGNGMLALLEHPDQMDRLRRNPSMIKTAVEELLRYTSPVFMSTERYAREDLNIQGVTIPRGGMTLGVIGSANRDETVFENADDLDISSGAEQAFVVRARYTLLRGRAAGSVGSTDRHQHASAADARSASERCA